MRQIPGLLCGYFADEDGTIYKTIKGQIVKAARWRANKYWRVWVRFGVGSHKAIAVHTLVLLTFQGPRPHLYECRHLDGNPDNNRNDNLKWGTKQENCDDKILHGTVINGTANGRAKLNEADVREIRALKGIVTQRNLSLRFGVSSGNIANIHRGSRWKHIIEHESATVYV